MRFQIGDVITGCTKCIPKNIGDGINKLVYRIWGVSQDMKYNLIPDLLKQSLKDIKQNLIDSFQKKIIRINILTKMPKYQTRLPDIKPIDRVVESMEFMSAQISDLIDMIQDQEKRLKVLENKQKVREDLEKERAEEKPKGWFGY